jgi:protein-tyrosine phosphatase
MKILMVCLGNICRSPLAEGILQQRANENKLNWVVESAGTNGLHNGEAPHRLSQKVAKENGVDISHQISRKFTPTDFDTYDKIYVMAKDVLEDVKKIAAEKFDNSKIDFFLNEINPNTNADIPDPWYGNEDGYVKVFKLIDETCNAIIQKYK